MYHLPQLDRIATHIRALHSTRRPGLCAGSAALLFALASAVDTTYAADGNCTLQLSNPVVDYGAVTRAELMKKQISPLLMTLGKQTATLTATCRQPVQMTIFFRGPAVDAGSYRFGNAGSFTLYLSNAQMDGKAVGLGSVISAGQVPENTGNSSALPPNTGATPIVNDRPIKGTSFSVQVDIEARVAVTGSRISDQTVWRGNGNFEMIEN
jgi:hypothetical protein